jgi:hypothetical protein
MKPHSGPPGEAWRLGQGPFIFSGVPPMCVGNLELVNESDEKVRVRTIRVVGHKDHAVSKLGLAELKVGTRLGPRAHTRAPAFFLLDPHTPPGKYTADLSCGSQHEPIIVHVWEKPGLSVDPGVIRLRGAGGDVLTAAAVISNQGNVTETFRELALVFLEETNWVQRSVVDALRETTAKDGYQGCLDRVVGELKGTLARPARVTLRNKVPELHPGETREIELEITLPAELLKGRTYFGSTAFMSARLNFNVECNGASNSTIRRPR